MVALDGTNTVLTEVTVTLVGEAGVINTDHMVLEVITKVTMVTDIMVNHTDMENDKLVLEVITTVTMVTDIMVNHTVTEHDKSRVAILCNSCVKFTIPFLYYVLVNVIDQTMDATLCRFKAT